MMCGVHIVFGVGAVVCVYIGGSRSVSGIHVRVLPDEELQEDHFLRSRADSRCCARQGCQGSSVHRQTACHGGTPLLLTQQCCSCHAAPGTSKCTAMEAPISLPMGACACMPLPTAFRTQANTCVLAAAFEFPHTVDR